MVGLEANAVSFLATFCHGKKQSEKVKSKLVITDTICVVMEPGKIEIRHWKMLERKRRLFFITFGPGTEIRNKARLT